MNSVDCSCVQNLTSTSMVYLVHKLCESRIGRLRFLEILIMRQDSTSYINHCQIKNNPEIVIKINDFWVSSWKSAWDVPEFLRSTFLALKMGEMQTWRISRLSKWRWKLGYRCSCGTWQCLMGVMRSAIEPPQLAIGGTLIRFPVERKNEKAEEEIYFWIIFNSFIHCILKSW